MCHLLQHRGEGIKKILKRVQDNINISLKRTYSHINLFTYSPYKKAAFTLAEVLVTLGIIGVVAALTIPALIADYKKIVYVNQLKKSVNVIENGFRLMMADDGADKLTDTCLWGTFSDSIGAGAIHTEFIGYMKKYFKVIDYNTIDLKDYKFLNGNSPGVNPRTNFILADGVYFMFGTVNKIPTSLSEEECKKVKELGGNFCEYAIRLIYIDVNGSKLPNQFGRDLFQFELSNDGRLIPEGGKDAALFKSQVALQNNTKYWNSSSSESNYRCNKNSAGYACAARIMENGWKMDY